MKTTPGTPPTATKKGGKLKPILIALAGVIAAMFLYAQIADTPTKTGSDTTPVATATTTKTAKEKKTKAPKPEKTTQPVPPASETATTTAPPPTTQEGPTAQEVAARAEAAVKDGLRVKEFSESCVRGSWACPISEVKAGGARGQVEVWVQEPLSKNQAEKLARTFFSFAGPTVKELEWVIVYDTSRNVRAQIQRSKISTLN